MPVAFKTSDTTVSLAPHVTSPGWPDVLSRLHRIGGLIERRVVARFGYPGASGEMEPRDLAVYGLGEYRGVWYAVGVEPGTEIIRAFALAEMESPVRDGSGEGAYGIPDDFEISSYLVLGWRLGPDPTPAVVRFDESLVPFVSSALADLGLKEGEDGSLVLEVDVGDLDRFVGWVLTFGTHARIEAPDAAVRRAREMLEAMVANNG